MKNLERNLEQVIRTDGFFAVVRGEVVDCEYADCEMCLFVGDGDKCADKRFRWLNEEYVAPPYLFDSERKFCELMGGGYIARDENGALFWFAVRPVKSNCKWLRTNLTPCIRLDRGFTEVLSDFTFKFVSWEDDEPYSVNFLLGE